MGILARAMKNTRVGMPIHDGQECPSYEQTTGGLSPPCSFRYQGWKIITSTNSSTAIPSTPNIAYTSHCGGPLARFL